MTVREYVRDPHRCQCDGDCETIGGCFYVERAAGWYEWWIENVPAARIAQDIDEWKRARAEGWDMTVLIAPTGGDVVVVGCRPRLICAASPLYALGDAPSLCEVKDGDRVGRAG